MVANASSILTGFFLAVAELSTCDVFVLSLYPCNKDLSISLSSFVPPSFVDQSNRPHKIFASGKSFFLETIINILQLASEINHDFNAFSNNFSLRTPLVIHTVTLLINSTFILFI